MKTINLMLIILGITLGGYSKAVITSAKYDGTIEVRGIVQRYLMNPRGKVDGLLLTDGTQVKFPPHMSAKLTFIISPKDEVTIKGFKENSKVFNAESITNTKTSQIIVESAPYANAFEREDTYENPLPSKRKGHFSNSRIGLKELSSHGTVQTQLFDRRGKVVGAILNDDSIVHFGKQAQQDTKLNADVGQVINASGYGTENAFGKSFEADKISNK